MGFYKSDFIFIYNLPNDINEGKLIADVPHISGLTTMCIHNLSTNTVKCAFALIDMNMPNYTNELADQRRNETRQAILAKGNNQLAVDAVWFKPYDVSLKEPYNDMIRSSFIFVYNIPSFGFVPENLQKTVGCRNRVQLLGELRQTKFSFLDMDTQSNIEFDQMITRLRSDPLPGLPDPKQLGVDEVYFRPFPSFVPVSPPKMVIPPIFTPPAQITPTPPARGSGPTDPEILSRLQRMSNSEVEKLLLTLRENEKQVRQMVPHDPSKVMELGQRIGEIADYYYERTNVTGEGPSSDRKRSYDPSLAFTPDNSKVARVNEPTPVAVIDDPMKKDICQSCFLFASNLSPAVNISRIPTEVPEVAKFIILDKSDPEALAGFALLRDFSPECRVKASTGLRRIQYLATRGRNPLQLDRVWLQPANAASSVVSRPPIVGNTNNASFVPPKSQSKGGKVGSLADAYNILPEESFFMMASGNCSTTVPVFYCLEVTNIPEHLTDYSLRNVLSPSNTFSTLRTINNSSRILVFGGSSQESMDLKEKLSSYLRTDTDIVVTACNLPSFLCPVPREIGRKVRSRRLIVTGLPHIPFELIRHRIAFFVSKATVCLFPHDANGLSLGHAYLGYTKFSDCDEDFINLKDWRFMEKSVFHVQFAVDSGWSNDGPLGMTLNPKMNNLITQEISHLRAQVAQEQELQSGNMGDAMINYKPNQPPAYDIHKIIGRHVYNAVSESLNALVVNSLNKDACAAAISVFIEAKLRGVKAFSMQLSKRGDSKCLILFFGPKMSSQCDAASAKLRKLFQEKDTQLDNLLNKTLLLERYKQNEFVPVSSEFALARGCQFLEVFELPIGDAWSKGTYQEILRSLFPNARSFYVPTVSDKGNSERVLGTAYVRFDDSRVCREAHKAMAPRCRYGSNREARVTYTALHMEVPASFSGYKTTCPVHNIFPWSRYDRQKEPFPWVSDNGSQTPFFCTCHFDSLPFKPAQTSIPLS